ncbi:MAG: UDP-N-acetylmuramyl-tripeptide synthetase [Candidatus Magasanikbacteria bacterium]|nr:UDP-N-acetylmuramyl-tripeptide synthetase [Candidatus Magasanikbacteria bacterium]
MLKNFLKRLCPADFLRFYHWTLAKTAACYYGHPSRRLIVVGITGTGGKSSTVYLLAKLLEAAGWKVGAASTIFFKIGAAEKLNDKKMTMLGRWQTQRLLARMAAAGCRLAIIETTSQGMEQYRHLGIDYDVAALTNFYPEHLEAHGGWENYKRAKAKLFAALSRAKKKNFAPPKTIVVNGDDASAPFFLSFAAEEKVAFGLGNFSFAGARSIKAEEVELSEKGIKFKVGVEEFHLPLLGRFNVYNALAAAAIASVLGLKWGEIAAAAQTLSTIPGRQEFIDEGQSFQVMVDYAFEPKALSELYEAVKLAPHQRIIHVLGSAGGGRDVSRRPKLGEIAGRGANYVIITNEDPYDDNPAQIIREVARGALSAGKQEGRDLFLILDRREAIAKALSLVREGDLVLLTGKGSEQAICVGNGKKIPWDDRRAVRQELKKSKI